MCVLGALLFAPNKSRINIATTYSPKFTHKISKLFNYVIREYKATLLPYQDVIAINSLAKQAMTNTS